MRADGTDRIFSCTEQRGGRNYGLCPHILDCDFILIVSVYPGYVAVRLNMWCDGPSVNRLFVAVMTNTPPRRHVAALESAVPGTR